jgi:hypothetical protein
MTVAIVCAPCGRSGDSNRLCALPPAQRSERGNGLALVRVHPAGTPSAIACVADRS